MIKKLKVRKGVPVPPHGDGSRYRYPWREMQIGDSFYVADKSIQHMTGSAYRLRPLRFTMKTENGGVRVWRVE